MENYYKEFNRDWYLSHDGAMLHTNGYPISAIQITEDDWLLHLMEKTWFDANTFLPAYFEALRRKGIKSVTIKTAY